MVVNADENGEGVREVPIKQDRIPEDLHKCEQWVCWREQVRDGEDKPTKLPVNPETASFASTTDPETWTDFETAWEFASEEADGIGFVFSEDDDFVGVDLDDCRDSQMGTATNLAREIIDRLDSYTEVSPSGTGFHIIVRGSLSGGRNRKGNVEIYDTARFFTVTGDHVPETPAEIHDRSEELASIYRDFLRDSLEANEDGDSLQPPDPEIVVSGSDDRTDAELLDQARNAANGDKFDRLWNGSTAGYESHSEADMALCCLLAFWTRGDAGWIDSLFRDSGLMRPKWDEVHYADGSTYGSKTIQRAIARTSEYYDPETDAKTRELKADFREGPSTTAVGNENATSNVGRESVYLEEQNRLLKQRVRDQDELIEQQADRIGELEGVIVELRVALADRNARIVMLHEKLSSNWTSIWSQARQRLAERVGE